MGNKRNKSEPYKIRMPLVAGPTTNNSVHDDIGDYEVQSERLQQNIIKDTGHTGYIGKLPKHQAEALESILSSKSADHYKTLSKYPDLRKLISQTKIAFDKLGQTRIIMGDSNNIDGFNLKVGALDKAVEYCELITHRRALFGLLWGATSATTLSGAAAGILYVCAHQSIITLSPQASLGSAAGIAVLCLLSLAAIITAAVLLSKSSSPSSKCGKHFTGRQKAASQTGIQLTTGNPR